MKMWAVVVGAALGAIGAWIGDVLWAGLMVGALAGVIVAGGELAERKMEK